MRILVTGSTAGLGLIAAQMLLRDGHEVVLHARNEQRLEALRHEVREASNVVIGDLANLAETTSVAAQVSSLGPIDAVIHNAGVYPTGGPERDADGVPAVVSVNLLSPYLLSALITTPSRVVYLSSDMHSSGRASVDDLVWTRRRWDPTQAYCDSKLCVTALASALARRRPDVVVNAVDPGWVATRMGGPHASADLESGAATQVWLATSNEAAATTTGGYWHHRRLARPAPAVHDTAFQDALLDALHELTGLGLPLADER